jgi:hypothetical protein
LPRCLDRRHASPLTGFLLAFLARARFRGNINYRKSDLPRLPSSGKTPTVAGSHFADAGHASHDERIAALPEAAFAPGFGADMVLATVVRLVPARDKALVFCRALPLGV